MMVSIGSLRCIIGSSTSEVQEKQEGADSQDWSLTDAQKN